MKLLEKIPKSITLLFWMTVLTGVAYPLAVTVIAQLVFPKEANGSLIVSGGQVRGSGLIAQEFESPRFFRARPSATDYAYVGSGASNLAATNKALAAAALANKDSWEKAFGASEGGSAVPPEMLYASASGLDPDIGLEAALAQVDTVAAARGYTDAMKEALAAAIRKAAAASTTLLGPPRVNVTVLNASLDSDPGFAGTR